MSKFDENLLPGSKQEAGQLKYKRRRRIYEKLKAKKIPLSSVPEDAVLQEMEERKWRYLQFTFSVVVVFIVLAGLRESFLGIRLFFQGVSVPSEAKEERNISRVSSHMLRRKDENEYFPSEEADELHVGPLPAELRFLVDVREPLGQFDRALFWQVPRAGSATVKNILTQCFGLLSATETGAASVGEMLTIVSDLEGGQFINVDATSQAGIGHAAKLQAGNLPNLQLVATPFLYDAAEKLFSQYYRGRMFTMIRHPIERAASLYYRMAKDKNNDVLLPGMTLEDYARSSLVESNWMTRFLSNNLKDDVSLEHLVIAKEVLKTKCLVGLLKHKSESMRRFETYFNWVADSERTEECHSKILDWNWPNKNKHQPVREGSEAWGLLMKQNGFDVKLFHYAEEIFREQAAIFEKDRQAI